MVDNGKINIEYCTGALNGVCDKLWDVEKVGKNLDKTFKDRAGVEIMAHQCMGLCRLAEKNDQGNIKVDGTILLDVDPENVGVKALQRLVNDYL